MRALRTVWTGRTNASRMMELVMSGSTVTGMEVQIEAAVRTLVAKLMIALIGLLLYLLATILSPPPRWCPE